MPNWTDFSKWLNFALLIINTVLFDFKKYRLSLLRISISSDGIRDIKSGI